MATIFEKRNFYFRGFNKIPYTLDNETLAVLDFIHRWKIVDEVKKNASVYSLWNIRDVDTLLNISKKLYKSEHYYWVIMMMNDMMDPFFDWPLNEGDLRKYIISVYGVENIYSIHHYESEYDANIYALPAGHEVSDDYAYNKLAISNYDYESDLNEAKRSIRLLQPEYLDMVKKEREAILSSNFSRGI